MQILTRFWIEFDLDNTSSGRGCFGLQSGCGVTGYSLEDAKYLLQTLVFKDDPMPAIKRVHENIDVSTLDAGHILPNIGIPSDRGVWYPNISL